MNLLPHNQDNAVLLRLREELDRVYGARLDRVVLYGSRARGQARNDSDYDVAVFLRDLNDRRQERNRLADLATDILYSEGRLVHVLPFPAGSYDDRTPLMHEIRKDGRDL